MLSELGTKKNNGFTVLCDFGAGDKKNNGFTVFSEPGTKKTLVLLSFRSSGQKKLCFFVVFWRCFRSWGQKNTGFTVFSEPGTKKTLVLLCFLSSGQKWRS